MTCEHIRVRMSSCVSIYQYVLPSDINTTSGVGIEVETHVLIYVYVCIRVFACTIPLIIMCIHVYSCVTMCYHVLPCVTTLLTHAPPVEHRRNHL